MLYPLFEKQAVTTTNSNPPLFVAVLTVLQSPGFHLPLWFPAAPVWRPPTFLGLFLFLVGPSVAPAMLLKAKWYE